MTRPRTTHTPDRFGQSVADLAARIDDLNREKWQVTFRGARYFALQEEIDALSARKAELEQATPEMRRQFQAQSGGRGIAFLASAGALVLCMVMGWLPLWFIPAALIAVVIGFAVLGRRP